MTTPRLKLFGDTVKTLRRELAAAEDDYLELSDRDKKLARLREESDADLAAKYRMKEV